MKGVEDLKTLEKTIHGMEFKPLPFMLCVTNLILHDIEVPNVDYTDSLNRNTTAIRPRRIGLISSLLTAFREYLLRMAQEG